MTNMEPKTLKEIEAAEAAVFGNVSKEVVLTPKELAEIMLEDVFDGGK